MTMERGVNVKVVMLGSNYCGKTWLLQRYIYDNYITNPPLTAVIIITTLLSSRGIDKHFALWMIHKHNTVFKSHDHIIMHVYSKISYINM